MFLKGIGESQFCIYSIYDSMLFIFHFVRMRGCLFVFIFLFFFFKQKTAYEIRPSDWSSGSIYIRKQGRLTQPPVRSQYAGRIGSYKRAVGRLCT